MKLNDISEPLEAVMCRFAGSSFRDVNLNKTVFTDVALAEATFTDVNLANTKIRDANLSGASIADSNLKGMTIDGVAVMDLFAAYRAQQLGGTA